MSEILSKIPANLSKMGKDEVNREILRLGMIAELDAVSFYEQLAAATDRKDIKDVLTDIAKEEKTHMGEFQAMLLREDRQQESELEEARKEVRKLTGK